MRTQTALAGALLALASVSAVAQQRPKYDDAVDLTRKMQRVLSETGIWDKKTPQARVKAARDAEQLKTDIEKMFGTAPAGEFGQCRSAAIFMQAYVQNLNALTLIIEGRRQVTSSSDLYAPAFEAFQFGDAYRACQESLETLYAARPKR